eukprot:8709218-Pyramimonas_sp.AAC.1
MGRRGAKSVARRGGCEAMIQDAAEEWRESRSGGRRSGWGNIGHAGFKRPFLADRKPPRFEFPNGTPLGQRRDPRQGAPDFQPPPLPEARLVSMRK